MAGYGKNVKKTSLHSRKHQNQKDRNKNGPRNTSASGRQWTGREPAHVTADPKHLVWTLDTQGTALLQAAQAQHQQLQLREAGPAVPQQAGDRRLTAQAFLLSSGRAASPLLDTRDTAATVTPQPR